MSCHEKSRFERWLYRKTGLTITCQSCGAFTFRDTCGICRALIDARYEQQLRVMRGLSELHAANYVVVLDTKPTSRRWLN